MTKSQGRISALIVAVPTMIAALGGIFIPRIYEGVYPPDFLPGALPQDILTVLVCLFILTIFFRRKEVGYKETVVFLGLTGAVWYLYGIFTIERTYNLLYLFYVISFAASFWIILIRTFQIPWEGLEITLPRGIRTLSGITSLAIALLFTLLWSASLIPLMQTRNRIEYMYSIYVLDLVFIMPAFFMLALLTLKEKKTGLLLTPALMILGFFVIFPLGLNELMKPFFGQSIIIPSMLVSFLFSFLMLGVGLVHLSKLTIRETV